MRTARRLVSGTAALVLALTGCIGDRDSATGRSDRPELIRITALEQFDACDDLLGYLKDQAASRVGPYGIPGFTPYYGRVLMDAAVAAESAGAGAAGSGVDDRAAAMPPADAAPTTTAGDDYSGTNVQEQGVDEPDIVKTDGNHIFAIAGNDLRIVDASSGTPTLIATLDLPDDSFNHQLFLQGNRLLVIAQHYPQPVEGPLGGGPVDGGKTLRAADVFIAPMQAAKTMLLSVDVTDPTRPAVTSTMTIDGEFVSGRNVDGTGRLVIRSTPSHLDFVYPQGEGAEDDAKATNETVVADSTIEQWLPSYELDAGGAKSSGLLVDCEQVSRPEVFSGFGNLTVMTVDLSTDLAPGNATSVVTDSSRGQTVYASPKNLYVTTAKWVEPTAEGEFPPPTPDETTAIHMFDITGSSPALYVASGAVRGHLLNQYSLSEYQDVLRVATTAPGRFVAIPVEADGAAASGPEASALTTVPPEQVSESYVTTFRHDGNELVQVGQVGGLGKNEQIYAVRFLGPTGYVVTFRRTDPLYTVDLSDPASPRVVGELKINGYSAYLHPAGDGRLIGLGQDAGDDGRVKGMQLSLFDVSDPAHPSRLQQLAIDNSNSEAEYDPHAFLWWNKTSLAVVPLSAYGPDSQFAGAIAAHIDPSAISELGRVSHHGKAPSEGWDETIRRSVVIGGSLYTLSNIGLQASDLTTLADRGWVPFQAG